MKTFLVGYTGFVGSNLCKSKTFDGLFNSKNIKFAYNQNPDILIYAGVSAQKFIANTNPEQDFQIINNAIENIKKINPQKIVLISTIDIYNTPQNVDEDSKIVVSEDAYGKNRRYLEEWVQKNYDDYLIVRLPGLYGENLKKNFIYDLCNRIPNMIKENVFADLANKNKHIKLYYHKLDNGFYELNKINQNEKKKLEFILNDINFSALNFTDSRGIFQFYNLYYLWEHISIALKNKIKVLNIATEPIMVSELYKYVYNKNFENKLNKTIPYYNFKTKYSELFGGRNGYIFEKDFILSDIKSFIESQNMNGSDNL